MELREAQAQTGHLELQAQTVLRAQRVLRVELGQMVLLELRETSEQQGPLDLVSTARLVLLAWSALAELLDSLVDLEPLDQVLLEQRETQELLAQAVALLELPALTGRLVLRARQARLA
jgi:hypothetical protein